jgi:hypothetical protein
MTRRAHILLLGLLATACVDDHPIYDGVAFEVESAPPSPVSVESDRIELVVGVAVRVYAEPISRSDVEYRNRDAFSLRSEDPDILEVYNTDDERTFVLVGVAEGRTCLEVRVNRRERECIDVRVLPGLDD